MKSKVIVLALVLIVILGVWKGLDTVQVSQAQKSSNLTQESSPQAASAGNTEPITDDQGGIQVGIVWEKQVSSALQKFEIQINNHSVNLDNYDFAQNIKLEVNGKVDRAVVKLLNREGSGHHASAEISIESTNLVNLKSGDKVTLKINKLGDTPERKFDFVY